MTEENKQQYNAENIKVLKGLAAVREMPAMFLSNIEDGTALYQCFEETISNSVDEYLSGHCTKINVILYKDNSIEVSDNGRGIPVEKHPDTGISTLTTVLTTLHAGGKFDNDAYAISAGLHGVGVSAVNAVSEWMKAEVFRDGSKWFQEFRQGVPVKNIKEVGKSQKTGTTITFKPDETIFIHNNKYDAKRILNRVRELSYLNVGLELSFTDEASGNTETFKGKEGLTSYINHLNEKRVPINKDVILVGAEKDKIQVDIALQWTENNSEDVRCYTNTVLQGDGGTHYQGFRTGINKAINKVNDEKKWVRGIKEGIKIDDVLAGLTAVLSIKMGAPQFASQTKDKLINLEVKGVVDYIISEAIYSFCSEHTKTGKAIVSRIALQAKAREAARKAKDNILKKDDTNLSWSLPGKLSDCSEKDPKKREIFLVEGGSAGGTLKNGRNRNTQAVYSLRGKVLNTWKAKLSKCLDNEEIRNIMVALGVDISKTGETDCSKLRYDKVIICTDSDVDGEHIECLLITMFYKFMRPIIDEGHLYVAQPPLYKLTNKKGTIYIRDEKAYVAFKKKNKDMKQWSISRAKGLGELTVDTIIETVLDPKTRKLLKLTNDNDEITYAVVDLLMGSEIEDRAKFIENNATYAKNIDI